MSATCGRRRLSYLCDLGPMVWSDVERREHDRRHRDARRAAVTIPLLLVALAVVLVLRLYILW